MGTDLMRTNLMGTDLFSLWAEPVQRENRSVPIKFVLIKSVPIDPLLQRLAVAPGQHLDA